MVEFHWDAKWGWRNMTTQSHLRCRILGAGWTCCVSPSCFLDRESRGRLGRPHWCVRKQWSILSPFTWKAQRKNNCIICWTKSFQQMTWLGSFKKIQKCEWTPQLVNETSKCFCLLEVIFMESCTLQIATNPAHPPPPAPFLSWLWGDMLPSLRIHLVWLMMCTQRFWTHLPSLGLFYSIVCCATTLRIDGSAVINVKFA